MAMEESISQLPSSALGSRDEEMNVYLKVVKTVPMKVKRSDTIATLKENINRKEGISEMNQKLFFDGKLLPDAISIVGCGVQNNATLHLIARDYAALKIFIKTQPGHRVITLETRASRTVDDIKLMIQEKEGFHPNSFTLLCNGDLLEDSSILASVGIRNNSTFHLIFDKKQVRTFFVKAEGMMEAVKIRVKTTFTVEDVKGIVMSMIGETFDNDMSLYYAGQELDDSETLAFYDIEEGSGLDLLLSTGMQIFVKTLCGKTVTLKVKEHVTVKDIIPMTLHKLHKSIPNDVEVIRFFYAGKQLENDKYLVSYGIEHDSTLHVVLRTSRRSK